MKTAKILIVIADVLLFVLIISFGYFANSQLKKVQSSKVQAEVNEDVLGVEIYDISVKTISVCVKDSCLDIREDEVGEDIHDLNMYVVEYVMPFIEKESGGKVETFNNNGSFMHWKEDLVPETRGLTERIYRGLKLGEKRIDVVMKEGPYTNGFYAKQYIEVDNSSQKLFAWRDGMVIREIDLSAAKDDYVVRGVFPIIDKGPNPKAPSGRYMPYWMAFYYSRPQEAWYGLHGLVWWYEDDGRAVFEPESNIGIRRSNGCVRMVKDDAKFLYDNYNRGDFILIHE